MHSSECCHYLYELKQETAEDGMARLQSQFQNINTKVNQMWRTEGQMDGLTAGQTEILTKIIMLLML